MTALDDPLTPEPAATPEVAPAPAAAAVDAPVAADAPAAAAAGGEAAAGTTVAVVGRRRRRKFVLLGAMVMGALIVGSTATYYVITRKPLPIPDIVDPTATLPHYMYSVYGVDKPIGVAVSEDGGRIYVTEGGGVKALRTFDASGSLITEGSPAGTVDSGRVPIYDARDPLTGEIYVSDRLRFCIDIYDAEGIYQRTMTKPTGVDTWAPLGLAFATDGTLYVSDVGSEDHRVLAIDREGNVIDTITTESKLQYPNGIAPVSDAVYVTDSNNGQLVRSDATRTAVVIGRGVAPGDLGMPRGIVTDDRGRMYVVDITTHAISVYDLPKDGATRPVFVGTFGEEGRADGQFEFPNAVAADGRGHLFVSDQENNRIQVWGY